MHINSNGITITATKWPADDSIDALRYANNDILTTQKYWHFFNYNDMKIQKVIFNRPATIILWTDGSKTIVKCAEDEVYDAEKGFAIAVCKKVFGSDFKKIFKEYVPEEEMVTALYADKKIVFTKQQPSEGQKLFDAIKKMNEITSLKYNRNKEK